MTIFDGLMVFFTYSPFTPFSNEIVKYFEIGVGLTFISSLFVWLNRNRSQNEENGTEFQKQNDNRVFVNQAWENRMKFANKYVAISIIGLVLAFVFHLNLLSYVNIVIFIAEIYWGFIAIMRDDEEEDESWIEKRSRTVKILLWLVDYRKHPFHVPYLLFIAIVISFFIANQYGLELDHLDVSDEKDGWDLQLGIITLSGAVFASAFIYVIQNSDFFGIRQKRQSESKIIGLHFADLMVSALTMFVWIITFMSAR